MSRDLPPELVAAKEAHLAVMEAYFKGYTKPEGAVHPAQHMIFHVSSVVALAAAQSSDPAYFITAVSQGAMDAQKWARPMMEAAARAGGLELPEIETETPQ